MQQHMETDRLSLSTYLGFGIFCGEVLMENPRLFTFLNPKTKVGDQSSISVFCGKTGLALLRKHTIR